MASILEHRALVLATLLAGALVTGSASGAEPRAAVFEARVTTAFGSTKFAHQVDALLTTVARRGGYTVVDAHPTELEESCREVDCLPPIAEHHDLDVILTAIVEHDPKVNQDIVKILLFRRTSPTSVRTEQEVCPSCDQPQTLARVERLATQLLRSDPGTDSPPLEPLQLLSPDKLRGGAQAAHRRTIYRAIGFSSVVVLAGGIALTAAMAAKDGDCNEATPSGLPCRQMFDTTGGIATGAVLAAIGAAGTIGFLIAGYRPTSKPTLSIAPAWTPNSVSISTSLTF